MLKKVAITILALCAFDVLAFPGIASRSGPTANASVQSAPTGSEECSKANVAGTYVNVFGLFGSFRPGLLPGLLLNQLTLHEDGTADSYFTGDLDLPMNTAAASPSIGSWKCRDDGSLVLTVITADYFPVDPALVAADGLVPDIQLTNYVRTTMLFSVQDASALNAVETRNRVYAPTEDPSNPNLGVLQPLDTTIYVYKRLEASDADLLVP